MKGETSTVSRLLDKAKEALDKGEDVYIVSSSYHRAHELASTVGAKPLSMWNAEKLNDVIGATIIEDQSVSDNVHGVLRYIDIREKAKLRQK